jgi:DNA-binding NarL/FixJ family response regulator
MESHSPDGGKIKLILADNQRIVLHALSMLIESLGDFTVIGIVTNGYDLLKKLEVSKPDIILMDIVKPGPTSIEVTRIIDERMPWVKVISLSRFNHPIFIKEMLKHGARGFLSKNCSVEELQEGIMRVYTGKTYFCNLSSQVLLRDYSTESKAGIADFRDVTAREIEIISLLSDGLATKEIASKLFISDKTVERHKSNLLRKMHVRNTAQLIKVAMENGLLIQRN